MNCLLRSATRSLFFGLCTTALPSQQAPLDTAERTAVLERIGRALEESYVFPALGTACHDHLDKAVASGSFDDCTEPVAFARRLTEELQRITKDKHLRVRHREATLIEQEREDPIAARARQLRLQQERNFGFVRVERLDGNIGYLELRAFARLSDARRTAAAAMELLRGVDAVVFDLRKNGGGDPEMVQFLCSYFFAERTHLNSLYFRPTDSTTEFWTLDEVPGPRMPEVPLYVLTSDYTFSAAEEFTYNLKTRKRATIVGVTTGGGANPGGRVNVGRRFDVFVPTGRAINPITGTNWEGVGVEPDVRCDAVDALDEALSLARVAAATFHQRNADQRQQRIAKMRAEVASAEELAGKEQWQQASAAMTRALEAGTAAGLWDEGALNQLGYRYLGREWAPIAVTIFRFNAARHPRSANCYDSLAEALLAAGDRAQAIANYERSLELDPGNDNGRRMLERIRGNAEAGGGR